MISYKIGLTGAKEIATYLKTKEDTIKHMLPVLSKVAIQMQRNVLNNFKDESSPAGAWASLSDFTLFIKKYRVKSPESNPKILQDKGDMRKSVFPTVTDSDKVGVAVVSTTNKHAKLMQNGGTSEPSTVRIKNPRYNPKTKGGKKQYDVHIKGGHKIPARPFMVISADTQNKIVNLIQGYIQTNGR